MKNFKPANNIQDLQYFGEFGGVNPSISDSSTYTFLSAKTIYILTKRWRLWKELKLQMFRHLEWEQ
jgi:hypothetical protein